MAEHNELGKKGEELAAVHLVQQGYKIRERNWRFGQKEVDVIAVKDNILVIVEIKTRTGNIFGDPETFVSRDKQRHLIRAANAYLSWKGLEMEVRLDIIAIVFDKGGKHTLNHIPDAFYPTL